MSDRLFQAADRSRAGDSAPVTIVAVAVYDRGASVASGGRFRAELASYPVVCEVGGSPWEAVRQLVIGHRALLERHWSTGGSR